MTCRRVPPNSSSRPACQLDPDSEEQGSPAQGPIYRGTHRLLLLKNPPKPRTSLWNQSCSAFGVAVLRLVCLLRRSNGRQARWLLPLTPERKQRPDVKTARAATEPPGAVGQRPQLLDASSHLAVVGGCHLSTRPLAGIVQADGRARARFPRSGRPKASGRRCPRQGRTRTSPLARMRVRVSGSTKQLPRGARPHRCLPR